MLLIAALAGAALGAGPAIGAKHHRPHLVAAKAGAHGYVPVRHGRPPLTGTLPGGTPTTPTTTVPTTTTPAPTCPTALGVTEDEYHTYASRSALCPGSVTVQLHNAGQDDHDLKVVDLDHGTVVATWEIAHPGDAVAKHLSLAAGSYRLFCTLSDGNGVHDTLGMHAVITVG
jgi:hypothetical protein